MATKVLLMHLMNWREPTHHLAHIPVCEFYQSARFISHINLRSGPLKWLFQKELGRWLDKFSIIFKAEISISLLNGVTWFNCMQLPTGMRGNTRYVWLWYGEHSGAEISLPTEESLQFCFWFSVWCKIPSGSDKSAAIAASPQISLAAKLCINPQLLPLHDRGFIATKQGHDSLFALGVTALRCCRWQEGRKWFSTVGSA